MPVDYSLADLARLADVTPRTIRYYVAQGLLPSPDAAGPATRYSEGHLARLRLIRRLQRDHLPLAEIRERLEQMSDDEVVAALAATGNVPGAPGLDATRGDAVGFLRNLMTEARIEPNIHPVPDTPEPVRGAPAPPARSRLALRSAPMPAAMPPPADRSDWVPPPASAPAPRYSPERSPDRHGSDDRFISKPTRSTWERVAITPDIEIHIRRPLKPLDNKRADHLERYARELFEDKP